MKKINLKVLSTISLLTFSFPIESLFAGDDLIRPNPPMDSPMLYNTMQIESVSPITYDIIGNNLALAFNSAVGTATVTIQDQYGSTIYQSVVNTNTQSVLYIPIENWETGSYTITVTSESTNFVSGFQL